MEFWVYPVVHLCKAISPRPCRSEDPYIPRADREHLCCAVKQNLHGIHALISRSHMKSYGQRNGARRYPSDQQGIVRTCTRSGSRGCRSSRPVWLCTVPIRPLCSGAPVRLEISTIASRVVSMSLSSSTGLLFTCGTTNVTHDECWVEDSGW